MYGPLSKKLVQLQTLEMYNRTTNIIPIIKTRFIYPQLNAFPFFAGDLSVLNSTLQGFETAFVSCWIVKRSMRYVLLCLKFDFFYSWFVSTGLSRIEFWWISSISSLFNSLFSEIDSCISVWWNASDPPRTNDTIRS